MARASVVAYLMIGLALTAVGAAVAAVAAAAGWIGHLERLIARLFGFTSFHFQPVPILIAALLATVALVIVGTILNMAAVSAYNLSARFMGGVVIRMDDPDQGPVVVGDRSQSRPVI